MLEAETSIPTEQVLSEDLDIDIAIIVRERAKAKNKKPLRIFRWVADLAGEIGT